MPAIDANLGSAVALDLFAGQLGSQLGGLSGLMNIGVGTMSGGAFQPSGAPFTVSMPASGRASVDLGDGNTLVFNKSNSSMEIIDAQGNVTNVWGDPHLQENGKTIGTFYGPVTFQLSDGTDISVDTKAGTEGTGVTFANTVTITRGSNAVVINNLDQQTSAGLTATSSQDGYLLNATAPQGLVLDQAAGGQWIDSQTGQDVNAADLAATKPGDQAFIQFSQDLGQLLGSFLTSGLMSTALTALTSNNNQSLQNANPFSDIAFLGLAVAL